MKHCADHLQNMEGIQIAHKQTVESILEADEDPRPWTIRRILCPFHIPKPNEFQGIHIYSKRSKWTIDDILIFVS
jgi:hypothetical protein